MFSKIPPPFIKMKRIYSSSLEQIIRRKWTIDRSKVPIVKEDDLEEKFITGSGPGGQAVNRTNNCCMLKHMPTGLIVKCHQERSLEVNRKKAREILVTKLDNLFNGEESVEAQKRRQMEQKRVKVEQKRKKRELMKEHWRENQELT